MLSLPILKGRIGKWILALTEFDLCYESAKAVKGQVVADFVAQHHESLQNFVEPMLWTLFFGGSSCVKGVVSAWSSFRLRGQILSLLTQLIPVVPITKQNIWQSSRVPSY
jgi:ABC-type branched-subunit amino acid transport system permease subunit